jgi:CheY-like chemotaxis protein
MGAIVDLHGKEILVVEDDEMNFLYLSQIFKLTHGNITRAKNGKQALQFAQANKYDIILMDIQLPDISGNQVTYEIRRFDTQTPIIAQTASRAPDENEESLAAGCTEVLVKPYTFNGLSDVLKKYV